jgi:hypothetical protein
MPHFSIPRLRQNEAQKKPFGVYKCYGPSKKGARKKLARPPPSTFTKIKTINSPRHGWRGATTNAA